MTTELHQKLLEQLRTELAAKPSRQSRLAVHDELIAAMREAGATWRTIARYLAKAGVGISAEAVRSYWHRHHKARRKSVPQSHHKPQSKSWTFNPPSTLE